ncbi:hypothetical protein BCR35DRAFT_299196 [Leucosporidium creatinivorum]|uniref:Uncharacterized protein n=1 Tax=Leucosporidium creatinivorum TaxID=106004 RepID=A0A1Y2G155_9BASI|nr:hypothetical protein BCR35DRAFT_299196 [Leucosporidium creatinivorum]
MLPPAESTRMVYSKSKDALLPAQPPSSLRNAADSDSEEEPEAFFDCSDDLEEQPAPICRSLPVELLDLIFAQVGEDTKTLSACSLVSRAWGESARRKLFGCPLGVTDEESLRRVRNLLDSNRSLARSVRAVDLSNQQGRYRVSKLNEVFRRAAGVLRLTPNVTDITMLHVALSQLVRQKFFGTLRVLPIKDATFYSTGWSRTGSLNVAGEAPEIDALAHALVAWRSLKYLTLSGYVSYPQLLTSASPPVHAFPSYRLQGLRLVSCELQAPTLLWLLGSSGSSLRQLTLSATSGLDSEVLSHIFKLVGPTLEQLSLSLDRDDFTVPRPDMLDPTILAPLLNLKVIMLSTDQMFGDDVLAQLALLPRLESATLAFLTAFRHSSVDAFLANDLHTLDSLVLDTWDSMDIWNDSQRYHVAKLCTSKGIAFSLNGLTQEAIEDAWFGLDVGECWTVLEDQVWPTARCRWASDRSL